MIGVNSIMSSIVCGNFIKNYPCARILAKGAASNPWGISSTTMAFRAASNFTMSQSDSQTLKKDFWVKNKQLNRPMSPHLSVYKPQLTSMLSITHRITGMGASVVLYAGGIGALFCTSQSFPEIVQIIQDSVPHFLILATKTAIGGSLIYHTLNGVRHLIWDVGYGFQLKHLYLSGYIVVALTAIGTLAVFIRG